MPILWYVISMSVPSVRGLKETAPEAAVHAINPQQAVLLQDVLASKGVEPHAISALTSHAVMGTLLDAYFLGNYGAHAYPERKAMKQARVHLNRMAIIAAEAVENGAVGTYTGSPVENEAIIHGDYGTIDDYDRPGQGLRQFRRNGASRLFRSGLVTVSRADEAFGTTFAPIAIIGAGPAGILTGRTLRAAGFRNVTIFDRSGQVGGIWRRNDVAGGTKNNPFTIRYDSTVMRPPGKGDSNGMRRPEWDGVEGTGQDVFRFVNTLRGYGDNRHDARLRVAKASIENLEPGDLNHRLTITSNGTTELKEYPIVIYASGVGKPVPLSDPARMTTPNTPKEAGRRWQQQLSDEELRQLVGKKIILRGLGNSTAEMLYQFQKFEDKEGVSIDYTVLTHYPHAALQTPRQSINGFEQLFRDTSKPNLVTLAGDLKHIEALYWRAMHQGKIVGDVTHWVQDEGECRVTFRNGETASFPVDKSYTLIGYRQRPEGLAKMGIQVIDERLGIGAYDFDGEVQQAPGEEGRNRLYPGYFAIGPIVKTPYNPNAMVIPGIQYQLNDLLTTVTMRAAEYALRDESRAPIRAAKRAYYAHVIKRQAFIGYESFAAPANGRSPRSVPSRY